MSDHITCDFCSCPARYRIRLEQDVDRGGGSITSLCRECMGRGVQLRPDMVATLSLVQSPAWLASRWRAQAATLHGREEHDHGYCQIIEECAVQLEAATAAEGTA